MKKSPIPVNDTKKVDEFMEKLDHPFKAEVQALREVIKNVDEGITDMEEVNAKRPGLEKIVKE